mmetsp:Transcript_71010/g.159023  ORF Transcript_71010/g.159023 Transcript_71010/m.159023 type:complete len:205 (-) Transcript_71010:633-1247(-)
MSSSRGGWRRPRSPTARMRSRPAPSPTCVTRSIRRRRRWARRSSLEVGRATGVGTTSGASSRWRGPCAPSPSTLCSARRSRPSQRLTGSSIGGTTRSWRRTSAWTTGTSLAPRTPPSSARTGWSRSARPGDAWRPRRRRAAGSRTRTFWPPSRSGHLSRTPRAGTSYPRAMAGSGPIPSVSSATGWGASTRHRPRSSTQRLFSS